MTYGVTQQIRFCYGHRLQNYDGKCAHLHGHNAIAELTLEAQSLDSHGMVMDFAKIKKMLKAWIDETIDHRLLLEKSDPLVALLKKEGEPVVVTIKPPTAEVIAQWIYERARELKLPVTEVKLWETPEQFATYRGV